MVSKTFVYTEETAFKHFLFTNVTKFRVYFREKRS